MTSSAMLVLCLCGLVTGSGVSGGGDDGADGSSVNEILSSLSSSELSVADSKFSPISAALECRFWLSRALVIACSASDWEDSGMKATSLIEYIGFPRICATCSRRDIEMRKEEDAIFSSPARLSAMVAESVDGIRHIPTIP